MLLPHKKNRVITKLELFTNDGKKPLTFQGMFVDMINSDLVFKLPQNSWRVRINPKNIIEITKPNA